MTETADGISSQVADWAKKHGQPPSSAEDPTLDDLQAIIAELRPAEITGIVCNEQDLAELILGCGRPLEDGPDNLARMGIAIGISSFLPRGKVLKYGGPQAEAWVKDTVHELWKVAREPEVKTEGEQP